MNTFIDSIHLPVNEHWQPFLTDEVKQLLFEIESNVVKTNFTPPAERVLHFMNIDLKKIKVAIIGQDPYPQAGVATGRCFEVGTLKDWNQPFRNVSLRNIVRLVYKTYYNEIKSYKEIIPWNNLNKAILPPDQLFKNWEKQGVLLLNTTFTCEVGVSAAHSKIWHPFSQQLLQYITDYNPNLHWIIWGNHARNIIQDFEVRNMHQSNHPMMCSSKAEKDFLYGDYNTLEATKELIDWRGKACE